MSHSLESHDSALLGSQSSHSLSLGVDQLRVSEGGSLGTFSSLSPTSLMFPIPDSGFSTLPASSPSLAPSSLPSVSSSSSSFLPSSFSASSRFHPSSFVRSIFLVYSLFSFVFLALLFSPSFGLFGALFLFLVFILLFCSTISFSFLFFLFSFLSSSSWLNSVLGPFLLVSSASSSSYASFIRFAIFWCSFLGFSACLFASLFLLLAFLCRGFFLIGWAGGLSRECVRVVQRLSVADTLVCAFGWGGFCWVNSLFFPSPLT